MLVTRLISDTSTFAMKEIPIATPTESIDINRRRFFEFFSLCLPILNLPKMPSAGAIGMIFFVLFISLFENDTKVEIKKQKLSIKYILNNI
ncbi:hypothetical protein D3C73_1117880 [compost metagenome]